MKFCVTEKRKPYKRKNKKIKIGIALFLSGFLILFILADGYVRSIISSYPFNVASKTVLQIMDKAMANVVSKNEFNPNIIDNVIYGEDGTVLSIETNTLVLNKIKTDFSNEAKKLFAEYGNTITVSLPIGTLIGNEYTMGRGPEISFDLRYSYSLQPDLKSEFNEAGINNTIHTFYLDVKNSLFVVIPWGNLEKTVNTRYILAETVIAGKVPEAYTGVYGASDDDADNIFNHRAEVED